MRLQIFFVRSLLALNELARHDLAHSKTWRGLFALASDDLGVDLVGTRVEQLDGLVLELPHITIQAKVGVVLVNPLARDQLRGFNPYGLGLCHHRRLCRAGRQAEAEQPSHEQAYCCV